MPPGPRAGALCTAVTTSRTERDRDRDGEREVTTGNAATASASACPHHQLWPSPPSKANCPRAHGMGMRGGGAAVCPLRPSRLFHPAAFRLRAHRISCACTHATPCVCAVPCAPSNLMPSVTVPYSSNAAQSQSLRSGNPKGTEIFFSPESVQSVRSTLDTPAETAHRIG